MTASVINCKFDTHSLYYRDECNVIIPSTGDVDKMKVMYLVHGMHGTCHDWITFTNIVRAAENHGVAVVCPNAKNSFYADMYTGEAFYTYLTQELPAYLKRTFGFSDKRENNMIAGLSMGGYGAFKIAFNNPDKFYLAASFSGVLNMAGITKMQSGNPENDQRNMRLFEGIFGPEPELKLGGTNNDLVHLVNINNSVKGYSVKDLILYQYCGSSDFLYENNIAFKTAAEKAGLDIFYTTDSGDHSWEYWAKQVEMFLDRYHKTE